MHAPRGGDTTGGVGGLACELPPCGGEAFGSEGCTFIKQNKNFHVLNHFKLQKT